MLTVGMADNLRYATQPELARHQLHCSKCKLVHRFAQSMAFLDAMLSLAILQMMIMFLLAHTIVINMTFNKLRQKSNNLTNNNELGRNEWIIAMWLMHNAFVNPLSILLSVINDLQILIRNSMLNSLFLNEMPNSIELMFSPSHRPINVNCLAVVGRLGVSMMCVCCYFQFHMRF